MVQIKFLKAQNGDSFLISFKDDMGNPRNILIDGGTDATFHDGGNNLYGELKLEIDLIRARNEYIDLLILTHIDNDHICGVLKWFEMDKKAPELIKNIWFNSGKLIAEYLREPENPDLSIGLKIFKTTETGVNEAIEFENYLIKMKIWERKIILKNQNINDFGVQIKILSPDNNQLRKLLKEYKKVTGDTLYTTGKEKDWDIHLNSFIEEESKPAYKFKEDSSPKNGSSITFIITIQNLRFLFLGDSHPSGIANSLRECRYSEENPLEVEIIKISHHGSKSNTNNELLKLIKTNNYLISTDSSGNNHPNKRTLARIVHNNPNAIFHFNYKYVKENVMLPQDFKDFPGMKIRVTRKFDFNA